MGKARYIYFEDVIDEQLVKVQNRSRLINDLLRDYFKEQDFKQLTPEELQKKIDIAKIKQEMELKIKEVQNG